ncbi:OsmC family protein [Bradyrhizobium sp. USDA 10063]
MAMIRQRHALAQTVPTALLLSSRTRRDLLFSDELLSLEMADPTFKLALAITRETPERASDFARRIDSAMVAELIVRLPRMPAHVFICGSNPFVNIAADGSLMAGWTPRRSKRNDMAANDAALHDALDTVEGRSMTSQDKASKLREVIVASDPTNHGALVGRVDASQFPIGGPDGVGHVSPGPNPYDLLSASLAACTAMTVRFQARRQKFPLERVEVGVSFHHGAQGERDSFERTLVLEGELDAQQRAFLLEATNLCPVGEILGVSADIHTRPDATTSGHNARAQASYEDDLAALPIPYIDAD